MWKKPCFSLFFVDLAAIQCYNGLTDESVKAKKKNDKKKSIRNGRVKKNANYRVFREKCQRIS